jgi:hypothetical protein
VLVVDRHTLETINFLHFVDQVLLQFLRAADVEDFVRVDRTFGQLLTLLHEVALEHDDVLADRDEVFLFELRLRVLDENATLAAHARAEVHDAVDLGDLGRVLRTAASNNSATRGRPPVMSFVFDCLRGVLAINVPATISRLRSRRCARRTESGSWRAARPCRRDDDLRMQVFLVLNDDHRFLLRGLVHFLLHRDAFDDVVELHLPAFSEMNRHVVRIPLDEGFALLDLAAVRDGDDRADDHVWFSSSRPSSVMDGDGPFLFRAMLLPSSSFTSGDRCNGSCRRAWP